MPSRKWNRGSTRSGVEHVIDPTQIEFERNVRVAVRKLQRLRPHLTELECMKRIRQVPPSHLPDVTRQLSSALAVSVKHSRKTLSCAAPL